jgi:glycerol uptake facilitator-like aquaporin
MAMRASAAGVTLGDGLRSGESLAPRFWESLFVKTAWYPSGSAKKHLCAELIGSTLLHFLCAGAVAQGSDVTNFGTAYADHHNISGVLIAALGSGVAYAALLYSTAGDNGSGAKLNPAISTALFVARVIEADLLAAELAAQFSGALVGTLLWAACTPDGAEQYVERVPFHMENHRNIDPLASAALREAVVCFFLALVYLATAVDVHNRVYTRAFFPLACGLAVTVRAYQNPTRPRSRAPRRPCPQR